jgi:hypothetical protein
MVRAASFLANKLLQFLKQKEDFETQSVLKTLSHVKKSLHELKSVTPQAPLAKPSFAKAAPPLETKHVAVKEVVKEAVIERPSIYARLVDKVKKACPELKIKEHFEIKKAGIPDCDVVLLSGKLVPDVYQSLAKAIDKQLALTEIVMMESALMPDLLSKSYKLILASPSVKQMPGFMTQIKLTGKNKAYLGSSPLVFLDDPEALQANISLKQALWQTIKTQIS